MLTLTSKGLYCAAGDFYIDPSGPVDRAIITHAHSDHARRGSRLYICASPGAGLLKARLGKNINVKTHEYREPFQIAGVKLSLHSAGHILGSAQVRIEYGGEVWVVSGDYKREEDPTCAPFEAVKCDVFVTEATFGTPSFVWKKGNDLGHEIYEWWQENAALGMNSVVFAYSLGKAQRVLGVLASFAERPIYCDPPVMAMNACYREQGIRLAPTRCLSEADDELKGELILAPQSVLNSPRAKLLGSFRTAFASGWMNGSGRWGQRYDHGFVISDHADWNDLIRTVLETEAKRVYVQHRGNGALVRHLRSLGLEAHPDSALKEERREQLMLPVE